MSITGSDGKTKITLSAVGANPQLKRITDNTTIKSSLNNTSKVISQNLTVSADEIAGIISEGKKNINTVLEVYTNN